MHKVPAFRLLITSCIFIIIFFLSSCAEKFQLSVTASSGGLITMEPSGGSYAEGERVTLIAETSSGYYFTGWGNISDNSSNSAFENEVEITMPAENLQITAGFAVPGAGWTFLIYMAGDNSLSSYVNDDLLEVSEGLQASLDSGNTNVAGDVRVLVLTDKSGSADTLLYHAAPGTPSVIDDSDYPVGGEVNMGDPDVLKHFIEYGMAKYPSEHNALVLWNHGGGVKGIDDGVFSKEICEDDNDILYMNEVQTAVSTALESNSGNLDIIGMDACIMGEVETAYELKDHADYFVASMAEEWGYGWDYSEIFNKFTTSGTPPTPSEMADILVTQYRDSVNASGTSYHDTMTAVDLSKLEDLKTAIFEFAAAVHDNYLTDSSIKNEFETQRDSSVYFYTTGSSTEIRYNPYHDLYSFCEGIINNSEGHAEPYDFDANVETKAQAVLAALADAVVATYAEGNGTPGGFEYYETADSEAIRGLSIFIPHGEEIYDGKSHYAESGKWYTSAEMTASYSGSDDTFNMGSLDFCTVIDSGVGHILNVETWRELFEAWYDTDGDTPGTY